MSKNIYTENIGDSYNELKRELKDKYSDIMSELIRKLKVEITEKAMNIFGSETMSEFEESEKIKAEIAKRKKDFYESEKYLSLQRELSSLKDRLSVADDDEKKEITAEMKKRLDEISTLNVTIKNQLKGLSDALDKKSKSVMRSIEDNKQALDQLKKEIFDDIKKGIVECLNDFNEELSVLNEAFGVTDAAAELPFDEDNIRLDIPLFSFDESDFAPIGRKLENEDGTYIVSETPDSFKN